MLSLVQLSKSKFIAADQSTKDQLQRSYFGEMEGGNLALSPEEALYLIDARGASCAYNGVPQGFNDIAASFANSRKFMARYFTCKDWRDRGLIIKEPTFGYKQPAGTPLKQYPGSALELPAHRVDALFFPGDMIAVAPGDEASKRLYTDFWLGQYGTYKLADKGNISKFDIYETLFLIDRKILRLSNATRADAVRCARSRRKDFLRLYQVYKDWRDKGFIIKTGFKFGTHFRVYFPGAKPVKDGNWTHSKHVIHVFPKDSRLLISEWARAIRVAHSVRKTFILAIPGSATKRRVSIDYILYHRSGGGVVGTPDTAAPKYAMLSLSEEEYIGGGELAAAIMQAKEMRMELILAIADRESAVTYYKVRQIRLPRSENDYYEIEWVQP